MPRESRLDDEIAKAAKRAGAYHEKLHSSAFQPGLPDHLIGYRGRLVYLEAKTGTRLRPQQRRKLKQARAAGCIAEVCYDTCLLERILDAIDRGEAWEPETDLDKL